MMNTYIEKMDLYKSGYVSAIKIVSGRCRSVYVVLPNGHFREKQSEYIINSSQYFGTNGEDTVTYAGWGIPGIDSKGLLFPDNWVLGFTTFENDPMSLVEAENIADNIVNKLEEADNEEE